MGFDGNEVKILTLKFALTMFDYLQILKFALTIHII